MDAETKRLLKLKDKINAASEAELQEILAKEARRAQHKKLSEEFKEEKEEPGFDWEE